MMVRTLERHEACPGCGKLVDRYGDNVAAVLLFCSHDCKTMVKGGSKRASTPFDVALSMLVALLSAFVFAGFVLVAYRLLAPHL